MNRTRPLFHAGIAGALLSITGCGVAHEPMMPTPVLYSAGTIDPFAHIDDHRRTTTEHIFYATDREPQQDRADDPRYGNKTEGTLHFGEAEVRFGDPDLTWPDLHEASTAAERDRDIRVSLDRTRRHAGVDPVPGERLFDVHEEALAEWLDGINAQLAIADDREVLIYVHGAKVNFENACVVTAQLDHFSGRDFVGVAFSWPVHQTIFSYASGEDVRRAHASAHSLRQLVELLAEGTIAERINILAVSAGGKVLIRALTELRRAHPVLSERELHDRFRIGRVVFAAADVTLDTFLEDIHDVHAVASERVVFTVSDHDVALEMAERVMGGPVRTGEMAILEDERVLDDLAHLPRLEFINVSAAKEARGFDIEGHHYWYAHPWTYSDVVLLLRTDLSPAERGLEPSGTPGVWQLSPTYPDRVRESAARALGGAW